MTNARILVVDDENDIRELVREILSEEGYAVETAGNAAEARAACAFLLQKQRADGGWGESYLSCQDKVRCACWAC